MAARARLTLAIALLLPACSAPNTSSTPSTLPAGASNGARGHRPHIISHHFYPTLFVSHENGSLIEIGTQTGATEQLPTAGRAATSVVADASDDVFFGGSAGPGELVPPYASARLLNAGLGQGPSSLAVDGSGDLFASIPAGVQFYPPGATNSSITIATAPWPSAIALGPFASAIIASQTTIQMFNPPYTGAPVRR